MIDSRWRWNDSYKERRKIKLLRFKSSPLERDLIDKRPEAHPIAFYYAKTDRVNTPFHEGSNEIITIRRKKDEKRKEEDNAWYEIKEEKWRKREREREGEKRFDRGANLFKNNSTDASINFHFGHFKQTWRPSGRRLFQGMPLPHLTDTPRSRRSPLEIKFRRKKLIERQGKERTTWLRTEIFSTLLNISRNVRLDRARNID